jgi:hypothetical protein
MFKISSTFTPVFPYSPFGKCLWSINSPFGITELSTNSPVGITGLSINDVSPINFLPITAAFALYNELSSIGYYFE